ncbi:MAG: hypothetical protein P8Y09_08465 [Deltaproteobacteria bacterium]
MPDGVRRFKVVTRGRLGRFEYGVISYLLPKKDPFLEESGIDVGYGDALATGGGSRA